MGAHINVHKFVTFVEQISVIRLDFVPVVFDYIENGQEVLEERFGVTAVYKHVINNDFSSASFYLSFFASLFHLICTFIIITTKV